MTRTVCILLGAIVVASVGDSADSLAKGPTSDPQQSPSKRAHGVKEGKPTRASAPIDLLKKHQAEYVTPKTPVLVTIGKASYLTLSGTGAPGGESFTTKVGALYATAYTINMAKRMTGQHYLVAPLEGLWWGSQEGVEFIQQPRETWNWKLLIRTPDFVTKKDVKRAVARLTSENKNPAAAEIHLETLEEGRCVQVLHVGPYAAEAKTIATMKAFAQQKGLSLRGRHHEIYLSDPNRVSQEELRTILRYPVRLPG